MLVGPGVPDAVAVGDALAVGDTLGEEVALGLAPGPAEAEPLEVGEGDGEGLGDGDGLGVGDGVGVGVATGEGLGDGVWPTGVGVEARFSPTSSWPTPVASKWTVVTLFFIASTELVRIWCTSVKGADDPQPATSGAATSKPPSAMKIWVRRNTKILLALYRSETL